MRTVLVLLFGLAVALVSIGCEENRDPQTPDGAMHLLRDALMADDIAGLLDASSARTRTLLAEMQTLLREQRTAIDERYPDDEKAGTAVAYPDGVLAAGDMVALFTALVKPEFGKLDRNEELSFGMSTLGQPNIDGDRALVTTRSGETVEFVLEEDVWKTTVFERPIEQSLNRVKLNRQTLEENLKVFEEMKRRAAAEKAKKEGEEPAP